METNEVKDISGAKRSFDQLKESLSKIITDIIGTVNGDNSEIAIFIKQVLAAKDLVVIEEEVLTVPLLAKAIKEHKVANSNQVVVYKKEKENCYIVSFSFAKDKNLLPEEENKHVAFISKTLDEALIKMFGDKELIVLR